ncbi:DUF2955 domain-containing protein [Photobacterium angustum]|uniref:DUF2955 domain-containing protein n=1 Tax=Photobacterium angustum TaxID=661 RepID=A0A855S8Z4_PHOAN|nr:DUF2955 domain-containing protein [Photobacterium angustum]KJF83287.1 MFS transporter [Photobacterium damselae subsp. damselae]KJG08116.1 MFS transporter [Photobacterium angustum]KJG42864.1 MFS transporter [Photobacterium angustum]KJG47595.1 MFS transporter [Photobacterium angustum]KJG50162.1 MFS transporter [Photobacterium angustum]
MKTMRIWFGCVLGLAISMIFGWSYGFFAALLPIMVLMKAERWNLSLLVQLILGIIWVTVQVTFISGFLQPYPVLMTIAVGIMLLAKCKAMINPKTYLFGFSGLLVGSIALNFASYTGFDLEEFNITLWMSGLITAPICALAYFLFPEPETEQTAPSINNDTQRVDHIGMLRQTALGWLVAMVAFLLFQFGDLNDSLSAQASIFIVLAPMTLIGSMAVAKIRITGTFLGCLAGMIIQLGLYSWVNNGILFLMAYAIAAGFFCHWIAQGTIKSSIAFSAMSALTVPLTTSLIPEQKDAFFSILYRFSSIFVAVVATSIVIWITHHFLIRVIKAPNEQF